jgi:glucan phosphoethanolaminetransferase (alkaline phosphatase superfamily)
LTVVAVVAVALYVVLPVQMIVDRESTLRSIAAQRPDLSSRGLEIGLVAVLIYAGVLHAIDCVLLWWLVVKVRARRRWARWALTAFLVLATGAAFAISWTAGPQFAWAVLSTTAAHLVMAVLLWVPGSSRSFFTVDPAHPRRSTSLPSNQGTDSASTR